MSKNRFEDPHTRVPTSLVGRVGYAPGVSIYYTASGTLGTDYNIAVDNTGILLTDNAATGQTTYTITYLNKTLADIRSEISAASFSFSSIALNESTALNSGELTFDSGDFTSDSGHVVRLLRHVVKYNEETRIHLLPPYNEPRNRPWYARINIGQFSKDHLGSKHVFSIPEYRNQVWSTFYGFPFMEVEGEKPSFVGPKKVKVARTPVLWRNNNIVVGFRHRGSLHNLVEDVDENNGLIYLSTEIQDTEDMSISYVYREGSYIYKKINLNPSVEHNPFVIGQFVLFYVIPGLSQPGDISRPVTVFHKVSPTLLGAIYSLPRNDYPITLLGALQVRQTNTIDDLAISDTRSRGGGIKPERFHEAIQINKNVQSVADFGRIDGIPYPGSSVVIYKLPNALKQTMAVDEIEQRAKKHLSAGVVPIVEFE